MFTAYLLVFDAADFNSALFLQNPLTLNGLYTLFDTFVSHLQPILIYSYDTTNKKGCKSETNTLVKKMCLCRNHELNPV